MKINTYIYPDGTKGIRRPRDGEIFRIWDEVVQNEVVWQWDGYKEQWFRTKGSQESLDLNSATFCSKDEIVKCECGSEAVGSNKHSSWCVKS